MGYSVRHRHLFLFVLTFLLLVFTLHSFLSRPSAPPLSIKPVAAFHEARLSTSLTEKDFSGVIVPVPLELSPGETLGSLLQDSIGLDRSDARAFLGALEDRVNVRRLKAGQIGLAYYQDSAKLQGVEFRLDEGCLEVRRVAQAWQPLWREFERDVRVHRVGGELDGLLDSAIREAGGQPQLAYRMADVLQWDLDFNRDLRIGDRFEVLYEEVYLDGELVDPGQVLAMVYENRGDRLEAYRYGESGAYYDAEGRPLQKMFLRSPLPFTRVTSRFNLRRFHPVLKVHRPHYGVDYGAPVGTPVRATAGGTVLFAGTNGGAGKMVKLRHTNGYQTSYLHLSKFAPVARKGKRVRQGEVIGYVGSTGLSTGPHLDYRVKKNDRWIDPLSIKSVPSDPIRPLERPRFLAYRDALRQGLKTGEWNLTDTPVLKTRPTANSQGQRTLTR